MEEIVFHHTLPIQLRFNDVDKFGHVNNTVYFSFHNGTSYSSLPDTRKDNQLNTAVITNKTKDNADA